MSQTLKPLSVRDFMAMYNSDQTLFKTLPEFNFLEPISKKAKQNNCTCGMGGEINEQILRYNNFVQNLSDDLIDRVKQKFQVEKACFAVQNANSYEVKCY